ncbi:MAG: glycosyltransferase family 39 protein [Armatimonadota bacterium]
MRAKREEDRAAGPAALRWAVLALAGAFIALYLAIAPARMAYPYELEWMEGACVDHVQRVLEGKPLYVAPSLEFVPFVYPPFYFWVSAAAAKLIGVGFLPLRLVSLLSSLGCLALIFLMVRRQTRSAFAGVIGAGVFAACFRIAGAWYDIARVDMLATALLLGAVYLAQLDRGWELHAVAGALVALAFLSKQVALAAAGPLMVYMLIARRGRGVVFAASAVVLSALPALLLDHATGGWYRYYVFDLPRQHEVDWGAAAGFWTSDMLSCVPVALAFSIFGIASLWRGDWRAAWLWGAVLLGCMGVSWSGRAHSGGYNNVLIPAYAAISIVSAIGLEAALAATGATKRARVRAMGASALLVLAAAQFARLAYDPREQIPTAADRRAGEGLVEVVRAIPGDVYLPYHGYLPVLAGKRSYAHAMAIWDVARGADQEATDKLLGEVTGAIREQRFGSVIVDSDVFGQPELGDAYVRGVIPYAGEEFYPVTGMRTRPKYVCLPRR